MKRNGGHGGRGDNPGQLRLEWGGIAEQRPVVTTAPLPDSGPTTNNDEQSASTPPPLVQYLPWDFQKTFPQPTPEAIDAGVVSDEDATPENVRAMHEEQAGQMLWVLSELDCVLDARRKGVDPRNNKTPMLKEARERLQKFFETEPGRLERWWQTLMDTYEQSFGAEAADAFGKALRARQAGIPVTAEPSRLPATVSAAFPREKPAPLIKLRLAHPHRRIVARLPVPRPQPSAIAASRFGQEESGKPVRPGAHEVREITERQAEKLIDILDSVQQASGSCVPGEASRLQSLFDSGLAAYGEDFGQAAADQLEAYVRRQASLDPGCRHDR